MSARTLLGTTFLPKASTVRIVAPKPLLFVVSLAFFA